MAMTEAQKRARRNYVARNREKVIATQVATNRRRKDRARQMVIDFKNRPCADCDQEYPHYVMDLDHQRDKVSTINKFIARAASVARIQAELDKCEVVCANCHRLRHPPVQTRVT